MEQLILEIFKISPTLAICGVMWWKYNKDKDSILQKINKQYDELIKDVRKDSKEREIKYQETIDKLADKFGVVEDIKCDVEEIKRKLDK